VAGAELVGFMTCVRSAPGNLRRTGGAGLLSLDEALGAARAVIVVIPTSDHAAVARQAFARGVDVLLEKPITRTLQEATELIDLAESGGRILQVGHLERLIPGWWRPGR